MLMMVLCLGLVPLVSAGDGQVLYKEWVGLSGINNNVDTLKDHADYPGNPTDSMFMASIDVPDKAGVDNWGAEITGYIIPPASGDYTFITASDDDNELWLSTSGDPADGVMVANIEGWGGYYEWNKHASSTSAPIKLYANRKYHVMLRFSDGTGGGHMSAAWTGPAGSGLETAPPANGTGGNYIIGANSAHVTTVAPGIHIATNPSPVDGATEMSYEDDAILSWSAPVNSPPSAIIRYDIYASDDDITAGEPNGATGLVGSVAAGEPLQFTIPAAMLEKNTTYYWRVDTICMDGAPSTDPNNAVGALWSASTVWTKPFIVSDPVDASAWPGESASFTCEADAALGIDGYQWYKDGAIMTGETSNALAISNAQDADVADYYCIATNADGSIQSASASLTIKHMIAHWTFDEGQGSVAHDTSVDGPVADAVAMLGQNPIADANSLWSPDGMIGACLDLAGGSGGSAGEWFDTGLMAADLGLQGNTSKSVSVWVYPRQMNDGGIWDVGRRSGTQDWCLRTESESQGDHGWRVQYWGGDYNFNTNNAWNTRGYQMSSLNAWIHFVLTHDGARTKVYANGRMIVDWGKTINTGDQFSFRIGQYGPNNEKFNGLIDDMRLYDTALNHEEVAELYTSVMTDDPICVNENNPAMDLNNDCKVDVSDLALFVSEWAAAFYALPDLVSLLFVLGEVQDFFRPVS